MIVRLAVALALAAAPAARDPQAKAGEAAFAEERWDEASAAFDAAYRSTGDPAFLYARAQAERRAGRCRLAVVLYEQFAAATTAPEARAAAEQYIAECRALLPADAPVPEVEPRADDDPTGVPRISPPRPDAAPPWHRDATGGVLVGLGSAGLVAGAILVPLGYRTAAGASDAADDRDYRGDFTRARRLEIGGAVAMSVGAALLVAGIVRWATLARRSRRSGDTARR